MAQFRQEGEGAGGHYAHLLDFRNVSQTPCRLSGYPVRVTISEPGHPNVVAKRGSFFDALVTPASPMRPAEVTTLVIETRTHCPARDAGGPAGPIYRHVTVVLRGGILETTTPVARGLDLGCGAFLARFLAWK